MRILSLDGGGIRGLITLCFLVELERATGKTVPEMFDFFAGTSIGAIIICLFAIKKVSAKDILEKILTRDKLSRLLPESFLDSIFGIMQVQPKYQDTELPEILTELFQDLRLEDTDKKIMITGFDLENHHPLFFKNYQDKYNKSVLVRDACAVSASAPFYFPPHHIKDKSEGKDICIWGIDGGIVNNNPSDCALIDAILLDKSSKIGMLSIGTGFTHPTLDASDSPNWGVLEWITKGKLVRMMMGGNVDSSTYRARCLCQALGHKYVRVQHHIPVDNESLDNKESSNLEELKKIALDWWIIDGENTVALINDETLTTKPIE